MKKDIKEMWVTALKSGDYKQVKGSLNESLPDGVTGYCCLGVLCEISQKLTGFGISENHKETMESHILGPTILTWSGLTNREGDPVYYKGESHCMLTSLSSHNDADRSFAEIAEMIEKQL